MSFPTVHLHNTSYSFTNNAGTHNFKLCHSEPYLNFSPSNKVVVIGVSSFIGYHAATYLQSTYNIVAVENSINLPSTDNMAWLRWKSLLDKNMSPKYLNLSDEKKLTEMLSHHRPDMIVFVPTPLLSEVQDTNVSLFRVSHLASSLSDFVRLIKVVQSTFKDTRLVLFSLSSQSGFIHSIQRAWLKCFEFALSSFQGMHRLKTAIIRVNSAIGSFQSESNFDLKCYDMSEVMKILHYVIKNGKLCLELELDPCTAGRTDISLAVPKEKNIIMTTYFTDVIDPQHPYYFLPNSFLLLGPFLKGAIEHNLHVVIFHNALSQLFQDRVVQFYSKIEFVKVNKEGRTPNDKRFYLYYDYLIDNPLIDHVLMTDMRDVQFFNDPFEMMEVMGDQLYVGLDLPWFLDASSQGYVHAVLKMCYGNEESVSTAARSHPFINAGVIGGSRQTVLSMLHKTIDYLNKTNKYANCNMAAVNLVFHRYFGHQLYGGYPIQSGFKAQMPGPHGVAVKHKARSGWS